MILRNEGREPQVFRLRGGGGWGGHLDPEIIGPFEPQFGLRIRTQAPPPDPPLQCM